MVFLKILQFDVVFIFDVLWPVFFWYAVVNQAYMKNSVNILSEFTTVKDLALRFHLSRHTIFRLLKAGELGSVKIGHLIYVSNCDVEYLLLKNSRSKICDRAEGNEDSDVSVGQNGDKS